MNQIYRNAIIILQKALSEKISVSAASIESGFASSYFKNIKKKILTNPGFYGLGPKELDEFKKQLFDYSQLVFTPTKPSVPLSRTTKPKEETVYDSADDDDYDDRSIGEIIYNEDTKRIEKYYYRILVKNEPPLVGYLSREEMQLIYSLYSNIEGANLTQKKLSLNFPHLTVRDFKRILRAFNITKQTIPVAPHILNEKSNDEIAELVFKQRENSALKVIEAKKSEFYKKSYLELLDKLHMYKAEKDWVEKVVDKYYEDKDKSSVIAIEKKPAQSKEDSNNPNPIIVLFGDIHYGKYYDNVIYGRGYNKEIAHDRIMQIAEKAIQELKSTGSDKLIMFELGDKVEAIQEDGFHPAHTHKLDLFQEEQIFYAVDSLKKMILHIVDSMDYKVEIEMYCIGGNHDRIGKTREEDKNRTAAKIIAKILQRELECDTIKIHIPKDNIFKRVEGKLNFFGHHGDSSLSKAKPSELVNMWGEPGCYNILMQGHWHSINTSEGINFTTLTIPSVCSTDNFSKDELGKHSLPGFIIGQQPKKAYGFDFKKVTLY